MQGQDWETVVLKKKKPEQVKTGLPRGPTHAQKLDENTENYKDHKKVQKTLADAIRQRRIELKLTQEQLAQKVNVKVNIVNDIESQRGVYDSPTIEKIKRVLGITNKNLLTK
jgi:ribosome-binding protein aMBF1 (putative translation factor)